MLPYNCSENTSVGGTGLLSSNKLSYHKTTFAFLHI